MFFTAQEIRTAIDEYKLLYKSKDFNLFDYELKQGGNGIYKLFEGDYNFKLNKSEQRTVLDFYRIIHILYMRDMGKINHCVKYDSFMQLIHELKTQKTFTTITLLIARS